MIYTKSREPVEIGNGVLYVPGITNVGLITNEVGDVTELYLVDSGNCATDGEWVLKYIDDYYKKLNKKYIIKAIITTHGHPDHFGGHKTIKDKTGCEIWAAEEDVLPMGNPLVHCTVLWGGYPPHELRNPYFTPERIDVYRFIEDDDVFQLSGDRTISYIDLSGHTYKCLGIIVSNKKGEKIIFTGDAIFTREELGKFWIPFIVNPDQFLDSLRKIPKIDNTLCLIPSHGDVIYNDIIEETAEFNEISVLSAKQSIRNALKNKEFSTIDEITKYVADLNGYKMSFGQYSLMNSTIKSYLTIMHDKGEVEIKIEENVLYFYLPK